jgi:hypothetical protein
MANHTRILAVCESGEDRSVAFATLLKKRGYDNVLNCGITKVQPDTFAMLAKWADVIYVTADRSVWRQIPQLFRAKSVFVDIGYDVWQTPFDPRLKQVLQKKIDQLGL